MNNTVPARMVVVLGTLYAVGAGVLSAGPLSIFLVAAALGLLALAVTSTDSTQIIGSIVAAAMLLSVARSVAHVALPGLGVILAFGLLFLFGRGVLSGGCGCRLACHR